MTSFDDRERAFENKFARDEEMQFRIIARRNRLLGQWAAELMHLTPAEANAVYVRKVNNAGPDADGNVAVATGSGGASPPSVRRSPAAFADFSVALAAATWTRWRYRLPRATR